MPSSDWLNAIRKEIHYNAKQLKKVINGKDFKKYFGKIEGEKLAKVPRGFEKDDPELELLKYKSYLAVHNFSAKEVVLKNFIAHAAKVCKALQPFDKFLNQSMD